MNDNISGLYYKFFTVEDGHAKPKPFNGIQPATKWRAHLKDYIKKLKKSKKMNTVKSNSHYLPLWIDHIESNGGEYDGVVFK